MRKRVNTLFLAILVIFAVTACQNEEPLSATPSDVSPETEANVNNQEKPVEEQPANKQEVVIYSNHFDSEEDEIFLGLFNKSDLADKYELILVPIGGTDMTNRAIAEVNNPQADVIYGGSMLNHTQMKNAGVLAEFEPSWADDVDLVYKDTDGYFYGTKTESLNVIASLEKIDSMPKDWEDLAENYSGKYSLLNLAGGTSSTMHFSILERYKDPEGYLGVSEEGWAFMKKFRDGGRQQQDDYKSWFNGTETPIGMIWPNGVKEAEDNYGLQMEQMKPDYGMPFVTSCIGITNSGDEVRMDAAREIAEWIGSADHQYEFTIDSAAVPVNNEAAKKFPADHFGIVLNANVKPQNIDWNYVLEHADDWLIELELNYPAGRMD